MALEALANQAGDLEEVEKALLMQLEVVWRNLSHPELPIASYAAQPSSMKTPGLWKVIET